MMMMMMMMRMMMITYIPTYLSGESKGLGPREKDDDGDGCGGPVGM